MRRLTGNREMLALPALLELGKRVVGAGCSGGELQALAHVDHGSLMTLSRSISLAIRNASRTN